MSETEAIQLDDLTEKQQRIVRASYDVDENTRKAIANEADCSEKYVTQVLNEHRPEYYEKHIADARKNPNRKSNGHVKAENKRHTEAVYPVEMQLSEFEARLIGNRLWELGTIYEDRGNEWLESECKWWSRRFMSECKTRDSDE